MHQCGRNRQVARSSLQGGAECTLDDELRFTNKTQVREASNDTRSPTEVNKPEM
jgi:hypothetical protein